MHEMFISHRDYKATAREMRTIWSGSKMLKFTEFLIRLNTCWTVCATKI